MSSELDNNLQEQSNDLHSAGNERFDRPSTGYQREYRSGERTHRPRIHSARPYGAELVNREKPFRPEGFGAALQENSEGEAPQCNYRPRYNQQGNQSDRPARPYQSGYRPRYNQQGEEGGYRPHYNNNEEGSGYQPRQQYGGYRPRYNNNEEGSGYQSGYNNRYGNQGRYQPRQQQGNYRPRYNQQGEESGYRPRYNNNGEGGGYQPRPRSPYPKPYQRYNEGGYQPRRPQGGYVQDGYRKRTADYDPNAKYSYKKRIEYSQEHIDPNEPLRLNKFLSNAGVCSRREADEFIQAGVVMVNGVTVTELGSKVLRTDEVKFNDQLVSLEKKVYVLLNKPKDYVTTSDDPEQRKIVMDLVKDACEERIYPVGRLDRNTTGVLLLTNDGDLASKLTHPKFLKKKVYHVFLDKNVTAHDMQKIAEGIELDDGEIHADVIEYVNEETKNQVGIEIHSGRNRIVRRIFESLGYRVIKLDRVQFAGLTKKNVKRGDWRYLTEKEVSMLRMGAFE